MLRQIAEHPGLRARARARVRDELPPAPSIEKIRREGQRRMSPGGPRRGDDEKRRDIEPRGRGVALQAVTGPMRQSDNHVNRLKALQDYHRKRHDKRVYDAFRQGYPRFRDSTDAEIKQQPAFYQALKTGEFDELLGLTSGAPDPSDTMPGQGGVRDAAPRRALTPAEVNRRNREHYRANPLG